MSVLGVFQANGCAEARKLSGRGTQKGLTKSVLRSFVILAANVVLSWCCLELLCNQSLVSSALVLSV